MWQQSSHIIIEQEGQKPPYDWDKYAQAFFPKAEELVAEAEKAEKEGNKEKASELYMYVTSSCDRWKIC